MVRDVVTTYDTVGMDLDFGSWQTLAHSDWGEHLTGCIHIASKTLYLAPVKPAPGGDHYNTRQRGRHYAKLGGAIVEEITHNGRSPVSGRVATGHEQIAVYAQRSRGGDTESAGLEEYGGFALRMQATEADGSTSTTIPGSADHAKHISLAGTSGTLNDGSGRFNRQLEPCIMNAIHQYLDPILRKIHNVGSFTISAARTSPVAVATAVGGTVVAHRRMTMNASLLGGLGKAGLKKTGIKNP